MMISFFFSSCILLSLLSSEQMTYMVLCDDIKDHQFAQVYSIRYEFFFFANDINFCEQFSHYTTGRIKWSVVCRRISPPPPKKFPQRFLYMLILSENSQLHLSHFFAINLLLIHPFKRGEKNMVDFFTGSLSTLPSQFLLFIKNISMEKRKLQFDWGNGFHLSYGSRLVYWSKTDSRQRTHL